MRMVRRRGGSAQREFQNWKRKNHTGSCFNKESRKEMKCVMQCPVDPCTSMVVSNSEPWNRRCPWLAVPMWKCVQQERPEIETATVTQVPDQ